MSSRWWAAALLLSLAFPIMIGFKFRAVTSVGVSALFQNARFRTSHFWILVQLLTPSASTYTVASMKHVKPESLRLPSSWNGFSSGKINPYTATGTSASVAAARVAYCLGLKGPAYVVDTACSSALASCRVLMISVISPL